jgi:hypothetical protein
VPQMDLFDPDALYLGSISGIWTRIWAYMLWPNDETRREAYVLSMHADALAAIEKHADTDRDYARAHDIVYGNFCKLGGWTALAPRWRSDMDLRRAGKPLRTAAAILDIVRKTPSDTGSLNKAVHVIDKTGITYSLIILGHKDVRTTISYYAELDTLSAGRQFDAFLEAERSKARLRGRRP